MRKAMITSVSEFVEQEKRAFLFLVDIGVWAFRDTLKNCEDRAMNVGIFEDGMISVAAGLALQGFVPTIYGITPFIVERALEQLKLDFAYQGLQGNFITTGAAYDFSTLGYSHYCPGDVQILKTIPGFEIVTPGTAKEFTTLFEQAKQDGKPTYFRLSDYVNKTEVPVAFGEATVVKRGNKATVIAVSTTLDFVMEACKDMDVTILYYTTLEPFDYETLRREDKNGRIFLCEPFFAGTLTEDIRKALVGREIYIEAMGVPREIIRTYGTKQEKDVMFGLTGTGVRDRITKMLIEK